MTIVDVLRRLGARTVARNVNRHIDAALEAYLRSVPFTVSSRGDVLWYITDFYSKLFSWFCSENPPGNAPPSSWASADAKELLNRAYNSEDGFSIACSNAMTGVACGLPGVLEALTRAFICKKGGQNALRVFSDYYDYYHQTTGEPLLYWARVQLMREFFQYCGHTLPRSVRTDQPERYAMECESIISAYAQGVDKGIARLMML